MPRQQKINRNNPTPTAQIIDEREPELPDLPPSEMGDSSIPLRTIIYLEVGEMSQAHVQHLVNLVSKEYETARGGIHYIIPVRDGKLSTEIVFEDEFEKIVQELCEIKDGQIRLKDGATECRIIREHV